MGLITLGLTVMPTPSSEMHTKPMVCMQRECLERHGTSSLTLAQGIWDQLDDESKALILGRSPESKRSDTFSRIKPG